MQNDFANVEIDRHVVDVVATGVYFQLRVVSLISLIGLIGRSGLIETMRHSQDPSIGY